MLKQQTGLAEEYAAHFPKSAALYQRARERFPGGVTHDGRYLRPFPLYIDHADGPYKWDVDGHRLIDYVMGHGALLLGHNPPAALAATQAQLARGTHYGFGHELEIAWADEVCRLVPCAERAKFVSSGTEATLMALRVARAHTGRDLVVKFQGHFHGWQDYLQQGLKPPFDEPPPGIPQAVLDTVRVLPLDDRPGLELLLASQQVAAVIIEPAGGGNSALPVPIEYLGWLREVTRVTGTLLIFDEVVSGFRYAPGGAQERYGVIPDLTTLAKVLAGGLPGGALCGQAELFDRLSFSDDPKSPPRIAHPGTFNANPLSAAAGVATLRQFGDGQVQARADGAARALKGGFEAHIAASGAPLVVYGDSSVLRLVARPETIPPERPVAEWPLATLLAGLGGLAEPLRQAMLLEGVDFQRAYLMVSAIHDAETVPATIAAFGAALNRLARMGLWGRP